MGLKAFKPITPALRFKTTIDYSDLTPAKDKPKTPRSLLAPLRKTGGRNNHGRITCRHQGGGHRRHLRLIDFKRDKKDIPAKVASIEYDPNRTAFIALLNYSDGEKRYIISPIQLKVGDTVIASETADIQPGNHLSLSSIPVGTLLYCLEIVPKQGARVARSAGQFAQLMAKEGEYCQVKLPSGEMRKVHRTCTASIGQVSNLEHENVTVGKAGRSRWLGIRPSVRGVAMNPIDHPMGGGEGKASGGHPRSPWGQYAKGYKTRNKKRTDSFIVKRRK